MMNIAWIVAVCLAIVACAQPTPEPFDKLPQVIPGSCAVPQYPVEARHAEQSGDVVLRFIIDSHGNVTNTSIEKSSGYPILDNAAATALKTCRYEPAVKAGVAVESGADITYRWTFAGPDPGKLAK
jgi:TonB family protein